MRLTPTQVESFYQDGYLVVEGAFRMKYALKRLNRMGSDLV